MKQLFIFLTMLSVYGHAQQTPVYINFNETYENYNLQNTNGIPCVTYKFDTQKDFPNSFRYQIKETSKIFNAQIDGVKCVGFSVGEGDQNCGGGTNSRRSESIFTNLSNTGVGWYKLRFYIPNDFKIYRDINNLENRYIDHHIFQIIINQTLTGVKVNPLPQFLLNFEHELSNSQKATLSLNYGLEFRVLEQFVNCPPCGQSVCANCSLGSNFVANLNDQYWCGNSSKEKIILDNVDYGWNEILFKINWADNNNGYMDAYLNGNFVSGAGSTLHTFVGPNVYNKSMFPKINGNPSGNQKFVNAIKFGHYRYIDGQDPNVESEIYFEYFYADNNPTNIYNDFYTAINSNNGIINLQSNITCGYIEGADEYIFLIRDNEIGMDQYIGSSYNGLTISSLLQNATIEFGKKYDIAVRTRFNKGFNSKYNLPNEVRFVPNTKLISIQCDNNNISYNSTLVCETVLEASEYVFAIYDTVTGINYYSGSTNGQINVSTLFSQHNLLFDRKYLVRVRAKFDQYGLQGSYGEACEITFKSNIKNTSLEGVKVFPNPFENEIHFEGLKGENNKVKIFDIYGNSVFEQNNIRNNSINLNFLQKGFYILIISREGTEDSITLYKK